MHNGVFVVGTDTNVGKTIISAWLAFKLKGAYWKPIQTGYPPSRDSDTVKKLAHVTVFPEKYILKYPSSPHLAAKLERKKIDLSQIFLPKTTKFLVVEGAGGLLVPINKQNTILDLIKHLNLPVIIVARSCLGTINHSLLTMMVSRLYNLDVRAIILNGDLNHENKKAIEHYSKILVFEVKKYSNFLELMKQPLPKKLREIIKK